MRLPDWFEGLAGLFVVLLLTLTFIVAVLMVWPV